MAKYFQLSKQLEKTIRIFDKYIQKFTQCLKIKKYIYISHYRFCALRFEN